MLFILKSFLRISQTVSVANALKDFTIMNMTRKPAWLQKKISPSAHGEMEGLLKELNLNTVCQQARCPNITE